MKARPFWVAALGLLTLAQGCVSLGVECKTDKINAWARVSRVGLGVSQRQAANFAAFKEKVCP